MLLKLESLPVKGCWKLRATAGTVDSRLWHWRGRRQHAAGTGLPGGMHCRCCAHLTRSVAAVKPQLQLQTSDLVLSGCTSVK